MAKPAPLPFVAADVILVDGHPCGRAVCGSEYHAGPLVSPDEWASGAARSFCDRGAAPQPQRAAIAAEIARQLRR
jgi:hypothetical protein